MEAGRREEVSRFILPIVDHESDQVFPSDRAVVISRWRPSHPPFLVGVGKTTATACPSLMLYQRIVPSPNAATASPPVARDVYVPGHVGSGHLPFLLAVRREAVDDQSVPSKKLWWAGAMARLRDDSLNSNGNALPLSLGCGISFQSATITSSAWVVGAESAANRRTGLECMCCYGETSEVLRESLIGECDSSPVLRHAKPSCVFRKSAICGSLINDRVPSASKAPILESAEPNATPPPGRDAISNIVLAAAVQVARRATTVVIPATDDQIVGTI